MHPTAAVRKALANLTDEVLYCGLFNHTFDDISGSVPTRLRFVRFDNKTFECGMCESKRHESWDYKGHVIAGTRYYEQHKNYNLKAIKADGYTRKELLRWEYIRRHG
jgi:hypothetical protein